MYHLTAAWQCEMQRVVTDHRLEKQRVESAQFGLAAWSKKGHPRQAAVASRAHARIRDVSALHV